jgi:hypothetical protein
MADVVFAIEGVAVAAWATQAKTKDKETATAKHDSACLESMGGIPWSFLKLTVNSITQNYTATSFQ